MSMPDAPVIRYARTLDGVDIAYSTFGRGPALVCLPNVQLSHLHLEWQLATVRRWLRALAHSHTIVRIDHRGGGASSRGLQTDWSIDGLLLDVDAVVRAERLDRLALFGWISGSLPAIAYAARHPERVTHLVLWCGFARNAAHGQGPRLGSLFAMARTDWELFTESISQAALGWRDAGQAREWARVLRAATTQQEFLAFLEARAGWDVTGALPGVRAPTLVLHDAANALASEARSREIAAAIDHAQMQVVQSDAGVPDRATSDLINGFLANRAAIVVPELTRRESEVLAELATGASNAEIAARLSISINTVMRHLTHIYAKTGTENRAQAIRYAWEHGIAQ